MCLFPCMTCHVRERIRDAANKQTLTGRKLTVPGLFCVFTAWESPMPGYRRSSSCHLCRCCPIALGTIRVALGAVTVAHVPLLRHRRRCSLHGLPSAASDSAFIPFSVRDCGFLQSPVEDLFELNRL